MGWGIGAAGGGLAYPELSLLMLYGRLGLLLNSPENIIRLSVRET
jgi:hypothetical protein